MQDFLIALAWFAALVIFILCIYGAIDRKRRREAMRMKGMRNAETAAMMAIARRRELPVTHGFRNDYVPVRNSRFERDRQSAAMRNTTQDERRNSVRGHIDNQAVFYPIINPDLNVPPSNPPVQPEPEPSPRASGISAYRTGGSDDAPSGFRTGGSISNAGFTTGGSDMTPSYKPSTPYDGGSKSDWSPSSGSGSSSSSDSGSSSSSDSGGGGGGGGSE